MKNFNVVELVLADRWKVFNGEDRNRFKVPMVLQDHTWQRPQLAVGMFLHAPFALAAPLDSTFLTLN